MLGEVSSIDGVLVCINIWCLILQRPDSAPTYEMQLNYILGKSQILEKTWFILWLSGAKYAQSVHNRIYSTEMFFHWINSFSLYCCMHFSSALCHPCVTEWLVILSWYEVRLTCTVADHTVEVKSLSGWQMQHVIYLQFFFFFFMQINQTWCCKHFGLELNLPQSKWPYTDSLWLHLSLLQTCASPRRSLCWWYLYVGWQHMVHTR